MRSLRSPGRRGDLAPCPCPRAARQVLCLIALGGSSLALPARSFELDPQPGCWSFTQSYAQANSPQGTTYFATDPARAIPTNRWWSSLGWSFSGTQPYSERVYPHPLAVAAEPDGLGLVYPDEPHVAGDGSVQVELWSAFGNGETQVDLGGAWLELPQQFTEGGPATAVPTSTPSGLLALVGGLTWVAHRFGPRPRRARHTAETGRLSA